MTVVITNVVFKSPKRQRAIFAFLIHPSIRWNNIYLSSLIARYERYVITGGIIKIKGDNNGLLNNKRKSKERFLTTRTITCVRYHCGISRCGFYCVSRFRLHKSASESNNIATIQAGVKALYTSASSFTGLTNTVAVQAKIFPDNMLSGTGNAAKPINAFKGNVTLAAAATGPSSAAGSSFTITYDNVPAAECVKITTAAAGNFTLLKWVLK